MASVMATVSTPVHVMPRSWGQDGIHNKGDMWCACHQGRNYIGYASQDGRNLTYIWWDELREAMSKAE